MKVSKQNIKNLLSSVSSDGRGAFERFYNLYYDQVFRLRIIALERKRLARRSCPTCSFLFGNQKHA